MKKILWSAMVVACFILLGCRQGRKSESQELVAEQEQTAEREDAEGETVAREGIYAYPGDYEMDSPTDLVAYFDSLCSEGAFLATHREDKKDSAVVWSAIRALDHFAQHKSKFFPLVEVRKALEILRLEQAYVYNHGGSDDPNGGEAFMFRLIEQAARLSYQIEYVTDFHADDRKAGVLYFEEWGLGNPLYSLLVYQTSQGFRVQMIGEKADAKIEKIFHLADGKGREYYLCSNNSDGVYFRQYLYGWQGDRLVMLRELDVPFGCSDCMEKGLELVFNPNQQTWSYCTKEGDLYHRVDSTPMLRLILDRTDSRFEVL